MCGPISSKPGTGTFLPGLLCSWLRAIAPSRSISNEQAAMMTLRLDNARDALPGDQASGFKSFELRAAEISTLQSQRDRCIPIEISDLHHPGRSDIGFRLIRPPFGPLEVSALAVQAIKAIPGPLDAELHSNNPPRLPKHPPEARHLGWAEAPYRDSSRKLGTDADRIRTSRK